MKWFVSPKTTATGKWQFCQIFQSENFFLSFIFFLEFITLKIFHFVTKSNEMKNDFTKYLDSRILRVLSVLSWNIFTFTLDSYASDERQETFENLGQVETKSIFSLNSYS